jgi:hypothetical protein
MSIKPLWIMVLVAICSATASSAVTASAEEPTDEIVVHARRDRAMDAFMRGDFVTAEKEFKDNYRCIRRAQMQQDAAFEQANIDMERAAVTGAIQNAVGDAKSPQVYNVPVMFNSPLRAEKIVDRTCSSPEWQFYMIGLSQIQLGHLVDAKENMYRVIRMSKEDTLYDAHYRVGLLELLDGNVHLAERRLDHLNDMLRHCTKQSSCEVHSDMAEAVAYLGAAIRDARSGHLRR